MKAIHVILFLLLPVCDALAQQYHRVILPAHVNSDRRELFPVWSPGGDTLFFQSDRKVEGRPWLYRYWYSLYKDGEFDTPRVYEEIKYTYDIGGMAKDFLGNVVIASTGGLNWHSAYELFDMSTFSGEYRARARIISRGGNTWDGDPSLTADGQRLYFASTGNLQLVDETTELFVSIKQGDGSWGPPINLGLNINGSAGNRFPSISPSGKTLYFTRVSENSATLYKSVRTGPAETDWSVAEPLAEPFNKPGHYTYGFAPHPSGLFVVVCSWNHLTDTGIDLYRINIGK